MNNLNTDSITTSLDRFKEGRQKLLETKDPIWFDFLKSESKILLRRAFKLWWNVRFGR